MSEENVTGRIKELFVTMNLQVEKMAQYSISSEKATEDIIQYVSSEIASESRGYMSTLYTLLSKETLKEPIFQNVDNANKFYNLELHKKIVEAYRFDSKDFPSFQNGINFKEINQAYASAVAGVGAAGVGGVLLGVLSGVVDMPIVGIIAGAIVAGLAGSGVTYFKIVPDINKQRFIETVKVFMADLEQEMYKWVDGVIAFYHARVDELKKTL